jgi:hypothetical protein
MLYLFKKVYLEHDANIDFNFDRVVISELNGVKNWSEIEKISGGELISYGKDLNSLNNVSSFLELLNKVKEQTIKSNKPVYIYADQKNYYKIIALWFKILLPNATTENIVEYVKLFFDYKNFLRISAYWNQVDKNKVTDIIFSQKNLRNEINSLDVNRNDYMTFINENIESFNVELLLSSFLYNGSRANELAKSVLPLIKIEISKYLYDLRETFMYNLVNAKFLKKIGIEETYNINNYMDIVKNENSIVKTFFNNSDVWKITLMCSETYHILLTNGSNSLINFENITENDIANIKQFLDILGVNNRESNFLIEIIPLLKTNSVTTEELKTLISYQNQQDSSFTTGTFYGLGFPTINTYFIQHIFNVYEDNKELLSGYVI